ncbi:ATP-binding protein [Roseiconus lacunae]|uniref:two-component system sensor histidine kinase NtrB n=1 Tax=Roseiconus lacunae TaxID=2605694 RepID=UPI003089C6B8|nr:ATP-binding protein [Stieleria sp. HD01]
MKSLRRNRLANLLLEASPAAVVLTDSQDHIVAMNHLAEESFGYQEHELLGRSIEEIFPSGDMATRPSSDDASQHACILSHLRDPDPDEDLFLQARRKDGQTFPAKVTLHPLTTDSRESCLANVIDLNQPKDQANASKHEKQIQGERLAAVLQMVSGLAHESGNALQRAQSCLDLLQLDLVDQSDLMTLTEQIRGALTDIQQNYEEVRDYAAPIVLKRRRVDLQKLCRTIFDELTESLGTDAPRLSLRCIAACQNIKLDAERISDVLRHVFENAIHASPAQGEIEFQCDCPGSPDASAIEIRIRDHGEGLSREVEQRMFEPFFTTKQQGTGLGLAVCRRIVEAHGGIIEATNAPEGGTVVRIRILVGNPTG